jgi:hypothetical protein
MRRIVRDYIGRVVFFHWIRTREPMSVCLAGFLCAGFEFKVMAFVSERAE